MTFRTLMLSAAAVLTLGVALPAFAEDAAPAQAPADKAVHKAKADTDGDGFVSKAEFMAEQEKRFAEIDSNGDGKLAEEEAKAYYAKMGAKRAAWLKEHAKKGAAPAQGE